MSARKNLGAIGNAKLAAKGGRVTAAESEAKAAALRALHKARRGVHVHPDLRERETVLGELAALLREPMPRVRSIRVVAAYCGVSDRQVRRWLSGQHWPSALQLRRMTQWVRAQGR